MRGKLLGRETSLQGSGQALLLSTPRVCPDWDHPPEHQLDLLESRPAAKGTGCSCCCSTCNEVGRVSGSGVMLKGQEIWWILASRARVAKKHPALPCPVVGTRDCPCRGPWTGAEEGGAHAGSALLSQMFAA